MCETENSWVPLSCVNPFIFITPGKPLMSLRSGVTFIISKQFDIKQRSSIYENNGEELGTSADSSAENRGAESVRTEGWNKHISRQFCRKQRNRICENSGIELDKLADSSAEVRGAESVRTVGWNWMHQQTVLQKTEEQNL
jgi:hypothetical protein